MTETIKPAVRTKKSKPLEITFTCPRCQKKYPMEDMRSIARFIPILIVCKQCEKEIS